MKIVKIYKSDKDKQGNPLKTKDGRPYTRIAIQTPEYGSKWISGFMGYWNSNWAEGMDVDIEIEEKGEYLNFKRPDPLKALEERVAKIEAELWVKKPAEDTDKVNEELSTIDNSDIPF